MLFEYLGLRLTAVLSETKGTCKTEGGRPAELSMRIAPELSAMTGSDKPEVDRKMAASRTGLIRSGLDVQTAQKISNGRKIARIAPIWMNN